MEALSSTGWAFDIAAAALAVNLVARVRVVLRGTSTSSASVTFESTFSPSSVLFRFSIELFASIAGDSTAVPAEVLLPLLSPLVGLTAVLDPGKPDSAEVERLSDCDVTKFKEEGLGRILDVKGGRVALAFLSDRLRFGRAGESGGEGGGGVVMVVTMSSVFVFVVTTVTVCLPGRFVFFRTDLSFAVFPCLLGGTAPARSSGTGVSGILAFATRLDFLGNSANEITRVRLRGEAAAAAPVLMSCSVAGGASALRFFVLGPLGKTSPLGPSGPSSGTHLVGNSCLIRVCLSCPVSCCSPQMSTANLSRLV